MAHFAKTRRDRAKQYWLLRHPMIVDRFYAYERGPHKGQFLAFDFREAAEVFSNVYRIGGVAIKELVW